MTVGAVDSASPGSNDMMRTTLDIDPKLLDQVVETTGENTKSAAVNKALEEYLREVRVKRLLALKGKLDLDLDDWYALRHR